MFWADELLKNRSGEEIINDSWTPSGIVHMGSLKVPVIHDTLYKILNEKKTPAVFMYGFDDMDVIDGLPSDLQESHGKYMGIPIFHAPSPDGKGSFGDYFGNKMKHLLDSLDIKPDSLYRTSELYKNGDFNKAIQFVLDNAAGVRKVYGDMYKKKIADDWYPFQVICPQCGKLGTTKVTAWDGKEVSFRCEENLVVWAKGCGYGGKMSPFDGNGKMPWKVEWAAKWWTFGVTIEGAGKDHASAGGSYDVAMNIVKDVFKSPQPLKLAYEFFLSDGKKMSSSKGLGLTGEQLVEVVPPQIARFLMIKTSPEQTVEFNPYQTLIISKLYDDFEKAAGSHEDHLLRPYHFSKIAEKTGYPKVRFLTLAQWVQMPGMETAIKDADAQSWTKYANVWVEKYAPDSEKFVVQKDMPEGVSNLTGKQKEYLKAVASVLSNNDNPEELQTKIYDLAKEVDIASKDGFAAIYIALIGKNHGPKAAWLIASLDKEFVKKRFEESSSLRLQQSNLIGKEDRHSGKRSASRIHESGQADSGQARMTGNKIHPNIFSIDPKVKEKFPSVSVGVAIIKGVSITKKNKDLEQEKEKLLASLENLTTEELGKYPEITSYRKLYKEMGIDWHSRRPSPEALLRRIALKKGLYNINTCVDAYNLVVMKNRVSVGAFDLDALQMPTILRFPKPGEEILLLGDDAPTIYKEKELAYFDKTGGFNIDFNYRDSQKTAVQLETKNLYINVDGIYDITPEKVEEVLKQTCDTILKYCGGKIEEFGVMST